MTKELEILKELVAEIEMIHHDSLSLYEPEVTPDYIQGFYECQKAVDAFYIRKLEEHILEGR